MSPASSLVAPQKSCWTVEEPQQGHPASSLAPPDASGSLRWSPEPKHSHPKSHPKDSSGSSSCCCWASVATAGGGTGQAADFCWVLVPVGTSAGGAPAAASVKMVFPGGYRAVFYKSESKASALFLSSTTVVFLALSPGLCSVPFLLLIVTSIKLCLHCNLNLTSFYEPSHILHPLSVLPYYLCIWPVASYPPCSWWREIRLWEVSSKAHLTPSIRREE